MDREKTFSVYMHTSPNGKIYIGITSQNPYNRWDRGEGYKKCPLFYNAIRKYGWDNFKHEILFSGIPQSTAETLEQQLIKQLNANNRVYGYNISSGGSVNSHMSDETKRKISDSEKGRKVSQKVIEAAHRKTGPNNPNFGKHESEEVRRKISRSMSGIHNHNYGTHRSEETKAKISKARKGFSVSNEVKQRISKNSFGAKNHRAHKVAQYTPELKLLKVWDCMSDAERTTNAHNIYGCCTGQRKTSGGYIWKYADGVEKIA